VSGVLHSLSSSRNRALKLAAQMTKDLRETEERFRVISENASDLIVLIDLQGPAGLRQPRLDRLFGGGQGSRRGRRSSRVSDHLRERWSASVHSQLPDWQAPAPPEAERRAQRKLPRLAPFRDVRATATTCCDSACESETPRCDWLRSSVPLRSEQPITSRLPRQSKSSDRSVRASRNPSVPTRSLSPPNSRS